MRLNMILFIKLVKNFKPKLKWCSNTIKKNWDVNYMLALKSFKHLFLNDSISKDKRLTFSRFVVISFYYFIFTSIIFFVFYI